MLVHTAASGVESPPGPSQPTSLHTNAFATLSAASRRLPRMAPDTESIMSRVKPVQSRTRPLHESANYFNALPTFDAYATYPPPLESHFEFKPAVQSPPSSAAVGLSSRISPPPPRLNPLNLPAPLQRSVMLETEDANFQNHQRCHLMKQRDYERHYKAYSRYYYGNPIDQETYRRYMRESLKHQMSDAEVYKKRNQQDKFSESRAALTQDRQDVQKDSQANLEKSRFLTQYRDANKTLMEEVAQRKKAEQAEIRRQERALMQMPIVNWRSTLK